MFYDWPVPWLCIKTSSCSLQVTLTRFCCSFDLILKETLTLKQCFKKFLHGKPVTESLHCQWIFLNLHHAKKINTMGSKAIFIMPCTGNSQSWYFSSLIRIWNAYIEMMSDDRILEICSDLLHFRWFHGKLPDGRKAAEMLLKQFNRGDGSFLVRESTTFVGDFSLSFWYVRVSEF